MMTALSKTFAQMQVQNTMWRFSNIAVVGLMVVVVTGCQTQRQLSVVRHGMTEAEVRSVFGAPDEVEPGKTYEQGRVLNWYYQAFVNQPYLEWVYIPGSRDYGGTLQQVQTSRGVRFRKFKIVFLDGIVVSAAELAPPDW